MQNRIILLKKVHLRLFTRNHECYVEAGFPWFSLGGFGVLSPRYFCHVLKTGFGAETVPKIRDKETDLNYTGDCVKCDSFRVLNACVTRSRALV